jgi:hypothetical protein
LEQSAYHFFNVIVSLNSRFLFSLSVSEISLASESCDGHTLIQRWKSAD